MLMSGRDSQKFKDISDSMHRQVPIIAAAAPKQADAKSLHTGRREGCFGGSAILYQRYVFGTGLVGPAPHCCVHDASKIIFLGAGCPPSPSVAQHEKQWG